MGSESLNEIIFYQSDQLSEHIEVRVKNDTVWLNRRQLADLYDRDIKTIGKHINNILQEELRGISVVANFATTEIYDVELKRLNEQVKRNIDRFPDNFRFQLTKDENLILRSQFATLKNELVTNCDWLNRLKHNTSTLFIRRLRRFYR